MSCLAYKQLELCQEYKLPDRIQVCTLYILQNNWNVFKLKYSDIFHLTQFKLSVMVNLQKELLGKAYYKKCLRGNFVRYFEIWTQQKLPSKGPIICPKGNICLVLDVLVYVLRKLNLILNINKPMFPILVVSNCVLFLQNTNVLALKQCIFPANFMPGLKAVNDTNVLKPRCQGWPSSDSTRPCTTKDRQRTEKE